MSNIIFEEWYKEMYGEKLFPNISNENNFKEACKSAYLFALESNKPNVVKENFKWTILEKPLYIGWTFYHNDLVAKWIKENPKPKDPEYINQKEIDEWRAEDKRLKKMSNKTQTKLKDLLLKLGITKSDFPTPIYEPSQLEKSSAWFRAKEKYEQQIRQSTIFDIGDRFYYVVYEDKPSEVDTLNESDLSGLDFHYTSEEACNKKILAYIEFNPNPLRIPESPFK